MTTGGGNPIRRVLAASEMPWGKAVRAVLLGAAALGSATILLGCSAWLISRASQHPHIDELTLVVVAVRALGIGRGLFRYLERLASHDVALTGLVRLRERCYRALASGPSSRLMAYRRGDLLDRLGTDIDAIGDLVVRGLLPFGSAAVVGLAGVVATAIILPVSGLSLMVALILAGVVAPWVNARAARASELAGAEAGTAVVTRTQALMDGWGEVEVAGATAALRAELAQDERRRLTAVDRAARPTAAAAFLQVLAQGLAVLAPILPGAQAVAEGRLSAPWLVVVVLLPLAVMEATTVLPAAAVELVRGHRSAQRLVELLEAPEADRQVAAAPIPADSPRRLAAQEVSAGWDNEAILTGVSLELDLRSPSAVAVVGPSGSGKTTLLLTLAGLLPPVAGSVRLDGQELSLLEPRARAGGVSFSAEDAHLFGTTLRENLRLACGDVPDEVLVQAVKRVGLGTWLAGLPRGLATPLASGGTDVSGGQRRRILAARALLTGATVLLFDEPTEHLDPASADAMLADLVRLKETGTTVVVATHRRVTTAGFDKVLEVDTVTVAGTR